MPVALITGATSPLGQAIASAIGDRGYDLILQVHRNSDLGKVVKCEVVRADLSSDDGQDQFCDEIEAKTKVIDVVVHNAASFTESNLRTLSRDDFRTTMSLNVEAPLFITKNLLHLLKKSDQASVVHMIDAMCMRVWDNRLAYDASKMLLAHLTQSLAVELAPHVRVNAVAPGLVSFPSDFSSLRRHRVTEKIPLKRTPSAEEIASTVAYLACDATSTTGQILVVDGGRHLVK